ncbi:hypothetical protein [Paludibacterium yongneupense]|uniref:hypothetical protein n=1 Tax=Paludibacterium yongneupense TaxID=400061 RepID=UPI0004206551|nr:hypothetical protein [Paludibacterium yongneupense]
MHPTDTRSSPLLEAHAVLAREILESERLRQTMRRPAFSATQQGLTPYTAWVDLHGFLEVDLSVELYAPQHPDSILGQFSGAGGGTMIGDAQLWGSCWLYEALKQGKSWRLSFAAHCIPGMLSIVWWDEEGPLASFVGAGPGTGGGLFGGQGKLESLDSLDGALACAA